MTTTNKLTTIRLAPNTLAQLADLERWGFGKFSQVVRIAIDRLWREEHARRTQTQEEPA